MHSFSSLNECPESDLSVIGFPEAIVKTNNIISGSKDKCAILASSPNKCVSEYKFPWVGSTTYNPLSLPTTISQEPLSNTAGNAFTKIASVYTLSLFPAYSSVITPVAFNAQAGIPTGTVGVVAATADGTPTARNTASKAATSLKSGVTGVSGVERNYGRNWLWFGSLSIAALFYLI
jgi:hypothetical protein